MTLVLEFHENEFGFSLKKLIDRRNKDRLKNVNHTFIKAFNKILK